MIRSLIAAMAFGTILSGPSASLEEGAQPSRRDSAAPTAVEWTVSPSHRDGQVQLSLSYRTNGSNSQTSRPWPIQRLQGLSAGQLNGGSGPASFRIAADAGSLDCAGALRAGRGGGTCEFRPDRAYAAELERRGFGRATDRQLYHLAVQGVGRELIAALEQHGYARTDVDGLVAAGIHGVTADYVRGMAQAGYRVGSLDKLVEFRIHGVTTDFVRELAAASPDLVRLHADRLVEMRIHGVSPRFVREMREAGLRELTPARLVEMRIHAVSPAFVREMSQLGYRDLPVSQLVAMRIHGVTPGWVRQLHARGIRPASSEDLVGLRIHGGRFE
jgi:hypothetical protein